MRCLLLLQADLRLADLRARRRAMEDLYAALQAVKSVHDALVRTLKIRSVVQFGDVSMYINYRFLNELTDLLCL